MSNFDDIFDTQSARKNLNDQPFDKDAWAEKKQAERKAVYDLADTTAEAVSMDGGKYRDYLDVQARFDRYSATNALLILAQMPQATQLKDFDGWRDAGASIKKQQKGISILEPVRNMTVRTAPKAPLTMSRKFLTFHRLPQGQRHSLRSA